jgi:hypothetical protein
MLLGDFWFTGSAGYNIISGITNLSSVTDMPSGRIQSASGLSGGLNTADVWFYSGSMPTYAVLDSWHTRTGLNCLLQFPSCHYSNAQGSLTITYSGTTLGTIVSAGTIGWCAIGYQAQVVSGRPMLFGTAGLVGSDADIIMTKTTVALNDLWCCQLSITLSNSFLQVLL